MIDRGFIKWQPFNSCFETQKVADNINREKMKEKIPVLYSDQIEALEEKINAAFQLKTNINIYYYEDGMFYNIIGKITFIDIYKKKIYLNNKSIYFKQILKITIF